MMRDAIGFALVLVNGVILLSFVTYCAGIRGPANIPPGLAIGVFSYLTANLACAGFLTFGKQP